MAKTKLRKCTFTDPIEGKRWHGFTDGSRWNGFRNVWVTPETHREILLTYWPSGTDDEGGFHELTADEAGLVYLGGGAFCAG